jgi:hypothetical protein
VKDSKNPPSNTKIQPGISILKNPIFKKNAAGIFLIHDKRISIDNITVVTI